jgi:hypothetical protein
MARVWREGQLKPVWIYRLLMTGSIEEKVYQRQLSKIGLSRAIVDESAQQRSFSSDELKSLFKIASDTLCDTHNAIKCNCNGSVSVIRNPTYVPGWGESYSWLSVSSTASFLEPASPPFFCFLGAGDFRGAGQCLHHLAELHISPLLPAPCHILQLQLDLKALLHHHPLPLLQGHPPLYPPALPLCKSKLPPEEGQEVEDYHI